MALKGTEGREETMGGFWRGSGRLGGKIGGGEEKDRRAKSAYGQRERWGTT